MNDIYLVYKTDAQHSYASRDIIGVATCVAMAISICTQKARKEGYKISKDQLFSLSNIKQTQGCSGEGEFQFESVDTDELI